MYKITKDSRQDKYKIIYFMPGDISNPLYSMENLSWEYVVLFCRHLEINPEDMTWIYDLVRISNKQVSVSDAGNWSVL